MPASSTEMVDALGDSTNAEILDWVSASGGCSEFVHAVFLGIQESFLAERAGSARTDIQWVIQAPEGPLHYQMNVHDGRCDVSPGEIEQPDVTLEMQLPDFLRMVLGSVSGDAAYGSGKLVIVGDPELAQAINGWFRMPG